MQNKKVPLSTTLEDLKEMDRNGELMRNFDRPVIKDTFVVPNPGYAIIRMLTHIYIYIVVRVIIIFTSLSLSIYRNIRFPRRQSGLLALSLSRTASFGERNEHGVQSGPRVPVSQAARIVDAMHGEKEHNQRSKSTTTNDKEAGKWIN